MIAFTDKSLHIYTDFSLSWATKLDSVPTHIAVTSFSNMPGLIVSLTDKGQLGIGYLGTKPPLSAVSSQSRALDYDKIDEEHKRLLLVRLI